MKWTLRGLPNQCIELHTGGPAEAAAWVRVFSRCARACVLSRCALSHTCVCVCVGEREGRRGDCDSGEGTAQAYLLRSSVLLIRKQPLSLSRARASSFSASVCSSIVFETCGNY